MNARTHLTVFVIGYTLTVTGAIIIKQLIGVHYHNYALIACVLLFIGGVLIGTTRPDNID